MRSSGGLSSLSSTSSSSPLLDDDDDVEIIDVPLTQRLRQRPPPKEKAAVKRKRKGTDDEDDDEDDEKDEEEDDDEEDVSVYSDGDDSYGPGPSSGRRSTSGSRNGDDDFTQQKGGGRPVSAAELKEFQDVVGSHLSRANCTQLIKKAGYSVETAINDYYAQLNDDGLPREEKKSSASTLPPATPFRLNRSASRGAASRTPFSGFSAPLFTPSPSSSSSLTSPAFSSLSSPSSSLSAFPDVQKPGAQQPVKRTSYDSASDSDDSADSDDSPPRRRRRGRPARQQAAAGTGRRGRALKKGGKGGKGAFDPTLPPPNYHSRPADSSLPSAAQRMSTYKEGMKVDAKIAGKWFPVQVLAVYEVGHVVKVNHPDWPPECAVFVDPVTHNLAPAGTKRAQYYSYEQVETFKEPPPKPPHPDAASYVWPGVQKEDESGEASLFLGSLQCRVVSDRAYGMKEWYDCLTSSADDDEAVKRWKTVETWLRKQSKLLEVEEKVEEVLERAQPVPSLSSSAGKKAQARLHSSFSWRLVERWIQLGYDVREIARSHHTDEDDNVKRSEQINELAEARGVCHRTGLADELQITSDGSSSDNTSASFSSDDDSDDLDSDDDDDDGGGPQGVMSVFQTVWGLTGTRKPSLTKRPSPFLLKSGTKGKKVTKEQRKAAQEEAASRAALASTAASARPLHTYTVTLNLFIKLSAQKSSPQSTALSLCPLNDLMSALYPAPTYPQLQAMIDEAQAPVPSALQSSVNLERLMSLSVRDEQGQPFFWEKRAEQQKKAAEEEKKAAEAKEKEEAAAVKKPAAKRGRKPAAKSRAQVAEVKKRAEEKADESDDSMDIGVGEKEEQLSVACGLTITLRDYQTHTVSWMLDQEAESACTNMYLWTQLKFPDEAVTYARWKQSTASTSSSSSSPPPVPIPADAEAPLFYYCPLLQRFRFKPLPLVRGGWNVEEMGLGKCFAAGTLLRLYDGGVKKVEEFKVNDVLMGDDSGPRTVTSLARGRALMYLIKPTWTGATAFTVNGDHILVLTCNAKPWLDSYWAPRNRWQVVSFVLGTDNRMEKVKENYYTLAAATAALEKLQEDWEPWQWEVSVDDFLSHPKSLRAVVKLIASPAITFVNPQLPSLYEVLTNALGVPPSPAQLDYMAWWLGMWVTDGVSACASISQGGAPPPDPHHHQIFARLHVYQQLFNEPVAQVFDKLSTAGWPVYFFKYGANSVAGHVLQLYGLLNNKHVPRALICDSLSVRRRFLAGIIDGDGYFMPPPDNVYEIAAEQQSVAQGYKTLAASLGLRNSKVAVTRCTNQQTGEVYTGHRVVLSGDMWDAVQYCAATYKRCPAPSSAEYVNKNKDSRCYGFSVAPLGEDDYYGFTVAGTNRRFLLEDFTVTHNTIGALALINVQRKTQSHGERAAQLERKEKTSGRGQGGDAGRAKAAAKKEKKSEAESRSSRYLRRSASTGQNDDDNDEEEEEEKEESKEEAKEKEDEEEKEEDDEDEDFVSRRGASSTPSGRSSSSPSSSSSTSSSSSPSPSPVSSASASSSSPSSSSSPVYVEETVDNVDPQGRIYTSCTLVVCPVSLVGQWANELSEKSSRPLKILLYHGGSRPRTVQKLLGYDVIITSYGIAASELTLGNNRVKHLIEKSPWLYKGQYAPEYQSLLNRFHWHRCILDESHVIRTMNSVACRAAYELVGDRLWMLTGTVVNTSLLDLKGQCKFLDMKGLIGQVWTDVDNVLVQNRKYEGRRDQRGRRLLTSKGRLTNLFVNLVTKSMIRHEKKQTFNGRAALIMLPPKRVQTIVVKPKAAERQAMDEMFQHAKARFEQYKADNVAVRRSVEVLQLLQPLRIACSAGTVDMVAHRERMRGELSRDAVRSVVEKFREKGSMTTEKFEVATEASINDIDGECSFCSECIRDLLLKARGAEKGTGSCPLCRSAISIDHLFAPCVRDVDDEEEKKETTEMEDDDVPIKKESTKVVKEQSGPAKKRKVVAKKKANDGESDAEEEKKEAGDQSAAAAAASPSLALSSSSSSSAVAPDEVKFDSKLNVLVRELNAMRADSSKHKALIFTQYLSTMELLKQTMAAHSFQYQTLEGHMTMRQRKRNLEEFRSNPQCAVFLLSMRSGAVGLTLTAASHVFILEPAINPALEQQAIGRIHRLGNVHPEVVVNYLIMEDSIEVNIMDINKGKLAQMEKAKQREDDLRAGLAAADVADEEAEEGGGEPRYGRHATNANADSGAGVNRVSQGSLQTDTALFRLGELDKLFQHRGNLRG